MAQNLNFNEANNQHSFFSVKEKAWHGLGKIVDSYPTSAEALHFAGLDFIVEKRKLFCDSKPVNMIQSLLDVPDHFATVRTDTNQVLGVVGKEYEIVQNVDAFNFFDAIVGGDGIQYETAGALGNGERIFITAKLPHYIKVDKEDLIEQYLFLTTSHDGYGSITAAFTPVRIVCQNTLNAAMRTHTNAIKIRHTANAKQRLDTAHTVLGISNTLSTQLEEIFTNWKKVQITDPELLRLIQLAMAPDKEVLKQVIQGNSEEYSTVFNNTCNAIFEYAQTNSTQQTNSTKGTLFGAYNAVSGYFQNVRNYKDPEAKIKSILYGGTAQIRTQKTFNLCTDFFQGELVGLVN